MLKFYVWTLCLKPIPIYAWNLKYRGLCYAKSFGLSASDPSVRISPGAITGKGDKFISDIFRSGAPL